MSVGPVGLLLLSPFLMLRFYGAMLVMVFKAACWLAERIASAIAYVWSYARERRALR